MFIEFVALIVRNRIHFYLKNAKMKNEKKRNFMNVPAAIRELEKIEMIRRSDGKYTLDHAVTATQKEILGAFGLDEMFIKQKASKLSEEIFAIEKRMLEKVEARRDKLASDLKSLFDKRDEMRKQEIWDAISKSRRTHEEILNFIKT